MTAVALSRYREGRYLHDDGKGEIWMTGNIISLGLTGGTVVDGRIVDPIAIDPDGGPYISVGENLEPYYGDGKDRVVERIEAGEVIKLWYKVETK